MPNLLSILRLLLVPPFLWLILSGHNVWAFVVLALSGVSDYLDGKIARRYNLVSKVGQMLDPIADRLFIFTTLLGLAVTDVIPWWLVMVLVAREAVIVVMLPLGAIYSLPPPPVHYVGKAATFNLLYSFPLLLLSEVQWGGADVAAVLGWAFAWWGIVLYWIAAGIYVLQVTDLVAQRRAWRAAQ